MENHQSEFAALSAYSTARWNKKCKELHSNSISVVCPFWIRQTTNHLPPIYSFIILSICTKKNTRVMQWHTHSCAYCQLCTSWSLLFEHYVWSFVVMLCQVSSHLRGELCRLISFCVTLCVLPAPLSLSSRCVWYWLFSRWQIVNKS